jgi:drug/metabolite transporter (DMT)-like permease
MWGSAFLLTKVAVGGLSVDLVVAGRLVIAAMLLIPPALVLEWRARRGAGPHLAWGARLWLFLTGITFFGYVAPFSLITWGLRFIDSGAAGILMAVMPLATLSLAHYLVPGEPMTRYRAVGFLLGFCGVAVLMGPAAMTGLAVGEGRLLPMLAVLAGALCYAVSAILARLRPPSAALPSAAVTIVLAAVLMLPGLPATGFIGSLGAAGRLPAAALLLLGVFSTAGAAVVYMGLVKRAGPAFVSQLNYLIPLWAVLLGMLFLGEPVLGRHLAALVLILGGILVTRLEPRGPRV